MGNCISLYCICFYCCITNYYKTLPRKTKRIISLLQCTKIQFSWVFCFRLSQEATVEVSAMAVVILSHDVGGIQLLAGCWTEGLSSSVVVAQRPPSVLSPVDVSSMTSCVIKVCGLRRKQESVSNAKITIFYNLITEVPLCFSWLEASH